jgi:hypothetical protein
VGPDFCDWDGVLPDDHRQIKVRFGLRISLRRLASPPAPASALARNTHHNRASETWPPNGVRCSASADGE